MLTMTNPPDRIAWQVADIPCVPVKELLSAILPVVDDTEVQAVVNEPFSLTTFRNDAYFPREPATCPDHEDVVYASLSAAFNAITTHRSSSLVELKILPSRRPDDWESADDWVCTKPHRPGAGLLLKQSSKGDVTTETNDVHIDIWMDIAVAFEYEKRPRWPDF